MDPRMMPPMGGQPMPMGPPPMPAQVPPGVVGPMQGAPDPSMMGGPPPQMPPPQPQQPPMPPPEALVPPTPEQLSEALLQELAKKEPADLEQFLAALSTQHQTDLLEIAQAVPETYDLILAAMPLPKDYAPERPKWFKLPPKPSPEDVLNLATTDYEYYKPLRERFATDVDLYFGRKVGSFKDDKDRKDLDRFSSISLASEINLGVAVLGANHPSYKVPVRSVDLKDECQHVEDWLYWLDDLAERRHARRGNGVFWRDVAFSLQVFGRVIQRRVLDLNDCEDPFDEVLLNPSICCPIEGGKHGLLRMTLRYEDSVAKLARDYDVAVSTITEPQGRNGKGDPWETLKPSTRVGVYEYWDEGWTCVMTDDGRIIKPIQEHKLGEVPFVYQIGSMGLPNFMSDPVRSLHGTPIIGGMLASEDVALKGVSAIHWLKTPNAQRESYLTMMVEALRKSAEPPIWMAVDTFAKNRARSTLGTRRNKVYTYEMGHEKPDVPNFAPLPAAVGPLFDALGSEWAMSSMPPAARGISDGASTGAAVESLSESGRDKLTADLQTMELFYGRRAEQSLRFFRDWGRLIQDYDGNYGVMSVPVVKPRTHQQAPVFQFHPETIVKTGATVNAKMTSLRLQNLGALGGAVAQWNGIGAMSLREAIELRGARDPDGIFSEIDYEKALMDDTLKDLRLLAALAARANVAIPPDEMATMQYEMFKKAVEAKIAQGSAGPGGNANPAQPAGVGAGMITPQVSQGVDMGTYGMSPGSQGGQVGRPPMSGESVGP